MITIKDDSKTVRRVIDASKEPKPDRKVRVAGDVHPPVPFVQIPAVIGEIIGRQLASLRALSASGVSLDPDELASLSEIAKTVSSIANAHKKLNEDKPLDALTEDEIRAALAVSK